MTRPRSRRPRSLSNTDAVRPGQSLPELQAQLSELRAALELQKREFEENAESCSQAIARVSHSERTLSQTKAKLIAAEEQAAQAAAQLVTLRARVQEADEKLQRFESERAAQSERERELTEARDRARVELEQQASEMASLRSELSAALEREPAFRQIETELRAEIEARQQLAERALAERQELRTLAESLSHDAAAAGEELNGALGQLGETRAELLDVRAALAAASEDREQLIGVLGAVETLAQRTARISAQARAARGQAPVSTEALETAREEDRVTLKPLAPPRESVRSLRRSTAPEIMVDGVLLAP